VTLRTTRRLATDGDSGGVAQLLLREIVAVHERQGRLSGFPDLSRCGHIVAPKLIHHTLSDIVWVFADQAIRGSTLPEGTRAR
jgi:hypothetical protein